jgi:hypothetical protein
MWEGKKVGNVDFFLCLRLRSRRKLDNEKLHTLYSLSEITVGIIKINENEMGGACSTRGRGG